MNEMCSEVVWSGFHQYPCSRKAKVQVDGKWYCRQHDPEAVARRQAERNAKGDRDYAVTKASDAKLVAARDFVNACVATRDRYGGLVLCDETRQAFKALLDAIDKLEELSK